MRRVRCSQIPEESVTLLTMSAGATSDSGDFSAEPFTSVLDYQGGLFTGSAELSYPIEVPPAEAGPTPSGCCRTRLATVDEYVDPSSNNQGGLIGLGWSYSPGGLPRAFRGCSSGEDLCGQ